MDQTLFTIIKYTLGILAVVVFRYLIPYVNLQLKNTRFEGLVNFVQKAVNAAESIFAFVEKSGSEKKEYVVDRIKEYVKEHNIKISDEQIDLLIQAIFTELDSVTINTYK